MKRICIAAAALLAAGPAMAQPAGHGQHHPAPPAPPHPPAQHPPVHGPRHPAPPPPPGGEEHAHASQADERAVLAVVERMFAALTAKSPQALLAEVVPEGRATANVLGRNRGIDGVAWPEFAAHLPRIPGRPVERLIGPHVHVEGDIAMIWSRYEFELDGRFLHCGVDHFDLIRQDGRWKVLNLTWTQQTENCPGRGPGARPEPPHGDPVAPRPPRQPQGERG